MTKKMFLGFVLILAVSFPGFSNGGRDDPPNDFTAPPLGLPMDLVVFPTKGNSETIEGYMAPVSIKVNSEGFQPLESAQLIYRDILGQEGYDQQNKFLLPGMWVSIPLEEGGFTVQMVFANIDIFIIEGERSGESDIIDEKRIAESEHYQFFVDVDMDEVRNAYKENGREVPNPLLVRLNIKQLKSHSNKIRSEYLDPFLTSRTGYVESQEVFYLIPKDNLDFKAIQKEIANSTDAKTLDDFIIDGSLFGEWIPIERMVDDGEIFNLKEEENGSQSFEVKKWPYDDRCHAG